MLKNIKVTTTNKTKFNPFDVTVSFRIDNEKDYNDFISATKSMDDGNNLEVLDSENKQYSALSTLIEAIVNKVK